MANRVRTFFIHRNTYSVLGTETIFNRAINLSSNTMRQYLKEAVIIGLTGEGNKLDQAYETSSLLTSRTNVHNNHSTI